MKATTIEKEKKFEPSHIELIIESEEELVELWHRLNIAHADMQALMQKYHYDPRVLRDNSMVLFNQIDELCQEHTVDLGKLAEA